jgi:cyclophilin family peptidyl-prolyl cis-trans isomerase
MTLGPFRRLAFAVLLALGVAACSPAGGGTDGTGGGGGPTAGCPTAQPPVLAAGSVRTVTIATDLGDIVIEVPIDQSPIATSNFVALAECGFYDGVVFHRVVPTFVIQGGDGQFGRVPTIQEGLVGSGDAGYEIQDEPVSADYVRGTVAMARSSQPNSQSSQFFVVLDDEAAFSLVQANNYAIIGSVTAGMETVDAIAAAADAEQPSDPVVMTDVSVSTP